MPTFAAQLIRWQKHHGRHHLPWQDTRDPYAIWLSEIMLQQTQVVTVIPYYLKFLQRFPDIKILALASLDEVLALWSGLGYYSRGRNLHQAAQLIVRDYRGKFPRDNELIQQLPGIGRSTAAAIAVFAYGERCAILDGNVKRVLARCFGIDGYPGESKTEQLLWQKAAELLPEKNIKGQIEAYTQALMDMGATVCTRTKPKCGVCPLQQDCVALREKRVDELPARKPRKPLPQKETVLLMLLKQGEILLEKRPSSGIWGGLWCLPEMPMNKNVTTYCMQHFGVKIKPLAELPPLDHSFTHFKLRIYPRPLQVVSLSPADTALAKPSGAGGGAKARSPQAGDYVANESARPAARQSEGMWIALNDALGAAIPAPVRTLLSQLPSRYHSTIVPA